MAERGLNQVDGCAVVEGVGSVSVPQPMRANGVRYADSFGRPAHNNPDAPAIQELPAAGWEHRNLGTCFAPDDHQL